MQIFNRILVVLFLTSSCSMETSKVKPTDDQNKCGSTSTAVELKFIDSLLGSMEGNVNLIRFGSIEQCSSFSVVTLDKAGFKQNNLSIRYSKIMMPMLMNKFPENYRYEVSPTIISYYMNLGNGIDDFDRVYKSIKLYDFCEFEEYLHSFFTTRNTEGFGGNVYLIHSGKNKRIGVIDRDSSKELKALVKGIYNKISIQESIQTFSLEKDWTQYRDSVSWMMTHKDSLNDLGRYKVVDNLW